jgi:tripartite-type tricarboxylate transporter receptor subunit TctC
VDSRRPFIFRFPARVVRSPGRVVRCVMAMFIWGMLSAHAVAQVAPYPARPVRWIVPLPPGGGADIVARTVAAPLSNRLGQQVIVDNRAGGGTVIGTGLAARAPADGYTLLLGTATTHAINVSLVKPLPYDAVKDFAPVSLVAILPQIIVIHPSLDAASLRALIDYARKRPGEISFASPGNGSASQLGGEMLNGVAQIRMVHVPYKGASPALTDLLAGDVQLMFTTVPPVLPHIKSGRLKALAVAAAKRSELLPNLPTTAEGGARGVEASSWNGVLVPAGTPGDVVRTIHGALAAVLALPEVRERLATAGVEPVVDTPAEFARYINAEIARYARVVETSRARLD